MSGFFNVNSYAGNIMNSIFNSLGNNSSNSGSGMSSKLGDYYSIQNGSYYKMAKKFYASEAVKDTTKVSSTQRQSTVSRYDKDALSLKTSKAKTSETMTAAGDALSSLSKLMDKKLYDKTSVTAEDGTKSEQYNQSAILDNLKGFIKDYNKLVEKAGDSDNKQTLENGVRMVNQTKVYANSLKDVGITIGDDNTLKLDEETFAKADMTDVRSLFTGNVSFAKNMQSYMLQVYSAESMGQTSVSGLYNAQAVSQLSVGSMFDRMF